jgi:hypothetical protein
MTPILSTVIKSHHGSADAGRIRAYLDDLIESSPALGPCRYALIDVMALKADSRVEVYEVREAGKESGRLLWLPDIPGAAVKPDSVCILWLPDTRSAAVKPYDSGEWQWTRASNPEDALRRYQEGRMQP